MPSPSSLKGSSGERPVGQRVGVILGKWNVRPEDIFSRPAAE